MIEESNLQKLIKSSLDLVKDEFGGYQMVADSANFQTNSKESFISYLKKFEDLGLSKIHELSHSGRRIAIFDLEDKYLDKLNGLRYIEVSEPKPGRKLKRNDWEYVSFVVSSYSKFLEERRADLVKIRQIGDDCFAYSRSHASSVQFRNKSVSDTDNSIGQIGIGAEVSSQVELEKQKRIQLMADFENYRKVTEKRMIEVRESAEIGLVKELLEVADDMERAITQGNVGGMSEIYAKFIQVLKTKNIVKLEIEKGTKFDPSRMEALTTIPSPEPSDAGTVQEVVQNGYMYLDGKLIRAAKVVVATE